MFIYHNTISGIKKKAQTASIFSTTEEEPRTTETEREKDRTREPEIEVLAYRRSKI